MSDPGARAKAKVALFLGAILVLLGAVGGLVEYRELRGLGDAPIDVTAEQTVALVAGGTRWVRLSDALEPDCRQALEEKVNGVVVGTGVLASDHAGQRWFYLTMKGQAACGAAAAPGLQGILKAADPALPDWLRDKGIEVPRGSFPLMELSTGEDPSSVRVLVMSFAAVGALGIVLVAAGMVTGR